MPNGLESKTERAIEILDAADALIGEVGYDAVSARDIAARAGVNKALVFYYWGSKAELFDKILERYYQAHRQALAGAFEAEGSTRERIHRVVDAYLDFMEQHRVYPRLIQQQLTGGGTHREAVLRHLAPFFDWTLLQLAEVTPRTGPLAARQFYLTISGIVTGYFTYAPALDSRWDGDPMSAEALDERRAHVHWMVDTLLSALDAESEKQEKSRD
ncbi:MAG: TetR family transcriptional regulator [Polyangia bacterium]|jgi:AcrR family transcriptional regulator|nr:TetR family transcriptional regulator [Polyangia bacterium]